MKQATFFTLKNFADLHNVHFFSGFILFVLFHYLFYFEYLFLF